MTESGGLAAAPDALVARVVERTIELASTPAPPLDEVDRTKLVSSWWAHLAGACVDEVGNVWAQVRDGGGSAVVVAAHLDTVFARSVAHAPRREGDRLIGPSVGDDSVAVAALAALDELLPARTGAPVWILATVGEEGLGDLLGIRHALAHPPFAIGAVVALEGNWLGRVCTTGVGSSRRRISFHGPGGHAWEAADVESAVHAAGRLVALLAEIDRTRPVGSSLNVGRLGGGTAVNARADHAWIEVDVRADRADVLAQLEAAVDDALSAVPTSLRIDVEQIGRRPAGSIPSDHALVRAATEALVAAGIEPVFTAASTDANAAHASGVPAVAVGVTIGAQEHTEQEWIELGPLALGLAILARTVHTIAKESL